MKNLSHETKVNIIKLVFIIITFLVISFFAFSCSSSCQTCKESYYEINIYSESSTQPIETYQAERIEPWDGYLIFWCDGVQYRTNRKYLVRKK
jgi:hypothetical protein